MTWRLRLVLVVLGGLALRVGYVYLYRHHARPTGDAFYFHNQANLLVSGQGFVDPYTLLWGFTAVPGANHPPLWTLVLALFALGSKSFFAQLLWGCVIGAVSVAAVALAAREVAGPRAGLIAASITALYPVFVIDDGALLAETLVVPLVALVVWAFYRLWRRPSLPRAAVLGALCALAALTRSELVLLVVFLAVPAGLLGRVRPWRRCLATSGGAVLAALAVFAPWWAYTVPRFSHPVFLSDQLGVTLASANCDQTYSGRLMGYWTDDCEVAVRKIPGQDASARDRQLRQVAMGYVEHHAGRVPAVMAARLGRALGFFRPGQQIYLEWSVLERPEVPATIGLFCYYVLAVLGAAGAFVVGRRHLPLVVFGVVLGEVVVVAVAIFGQTRYRTPLDVVLVVLGAVALDAVTTRDRSGRPPRPGGRWGRRRSSGAAA